jgi:hypothetical protein
MFHAIHPCTIFQLKVVAEVHIQNHRPTIRKVAVIRSTGRLLIIRDNQLTIGTFVKVLILGLALCDHGESKRKGETKYKVQSCPSIRVGDLLVYSSIVSFNVLSEIGFIK